MGSLRALFGQPLCLGSRRGLIGPPEGFYLVHSGAWAVLSRLAKGSKHIRAGHASGCSLVGSGAWVVPIRLANSGKYILVGNASGCSLVLWGLGGPDQSCQIWQVYLGWKCFWQNLAAVWLALGPVWARPDLPVGCKPNAIHVLPFDYHQYDLK